MLSLTESLPSLVARRFAAAKESGDVIFSATHLAVLGSKKSGIDYQLRYCPALAKKPTADKKPTEEKKQKKKDPFENPDAALLITNIPNNNDNNAHTHYLVLNKFPVIPNHFILATKAFKPQTDLLERNDLEAAVACLKAWSAPNHQHDEKEEGGRRRRRLFAFFNSGDESGASQPHRHLQFVPVEDMRDSSAAGSSEGWTPMIDHLSSSSSAAVKEDRAGIRHIPSLPFQHFALPLLPAEKEERDIHATYLALYRATLSAIGITDPTELSRSSGPAAISYNLAMTEEVMLLCPRQRENGVLPFSDSNGLAYVSLNGTILAGTLMVKSEEQWDRLKGDVELIDGLLADVGFPYNPIHSQI